MSHDLHTNPRAEPDLACPECHEPTRVIDRFTLGGSPGPVDHVKVICERGHWFMLPLEKLATMRDKHRVPERDEAATSQSQKAA